MGPQTRRQDCEWGTMTILVPVSWGELLDKITILEIKQERLGDPVKRANVTAELQALAEVRDGGAALPDAALSLIDELRSVNTELWVIEDDIRLCEAAGDFGVRFIQLARSVYFTNDRRAALKRRLNVLLDSELIEEKSYQDYGAKRPDASSEPPG